MYKNRKILYDFTLLISQICGTLSIVKTRMGKILYLIA